jgi:hypothetical protein
MKKLKCVLAILAAASTAAVAKDLKQDNKAKAPAVSVSQMTDAEMDKVTAGAIFVGFVVINGVEITAGLPIRMSMNTGPNPAGVLENNKGLFTLGPKQ